ncbi:MAG TPA: sugar phosphate nucleotidyltransferase [Planctomycetota bacterium]|jgi:glucose-1-phosphate thymidylyltransferase|nr:sugar phosphate nucleotidyltransferase [Planctomycetota bacterium]
MKGLKGVVLAGGLGTRLSPLTRVTNKHLLPIYKKPMIYYPIEKLVKAGLTEIMVVTGGPFAGDFLKLLGNGREFGLKDVHYTYQEGEGGIAQALGLTEHFVDRDRVCVILGDNIFSADIGRGVQDYMKQESGAKIFLKEVDDPERFGVAELKGRAVVGIEEKPKNPKSNYAVTGIYMFDNDVFSIVKTLKPSGRGELEITDVNNAYVRQGTLTYEILEGWWTDAGTFDSLYRANKLVTETPAMQ